MARTRARVKGRRDTSRFLGIPFAVIDSPDFRLLSPVAIKLLIFLVYQFNGSNNGDLSAPFSRVKEWGIKSEATLCKALKELMARRIITRTRDPTRDRQNPHGQCALYALNWYPIHECKGKLDLMPTLHPIRVFSIDKGS